MDIPVIHRLQVWSFQQAPFQRAGFDGILPFWWFLCLHRGQLFHLNRVIQISAAHESCDQQSKWYCLKSKKSGKVFPHQVGDFKSARDLPLASWVISCVSWASWGHLHAFPSQHRMLRFWQTLGTARCTYYCYKRTVYSCWAYLWVNAINFCSRLS